MKTLLLMRHAKSSRDDPSLPDHDRPLNQRGKSDGLVGISPQLAERRAPRRATTWTLRFASAPWQRFRLASNGS